jgi:hypothetical protein
MKWDKTGLWVGIAVFFLNLFDSISTQMLVSRGVPELNPIIEWCIGVMGGWFILPKTLLGLLFCILLPFGWDKRWVKIAGWSVLILYFIISIYHCVGLVLIFG